MKTKILALIFSVTLGSSVYGSGCSEMAAFNTQMNKSLEIVSLDYDTKKEIRDLMNQCNESHDMGLPVASIDTCNKALKMVAIN
mgnify:CR=1 FL=1|tara:strand:- start:779 stop:1030 length:252 start_codon:yes stop_codon:yes gene_type:complete